MACFHRFHELPISVMASVHPTSQAHNGITYPACLPAAICPNSSYSSEPELGSRRIVALLPVGQKQGH
jgi:hypothetical protein